MKKIFAFLAVVLCAAIASQTASAQELSKIEVSKHDYLTELICHRLADYDANLFTDGYIMAYFSPKDFGWSDNAFINNTMPDAKVREAFVRKFFTQQECAEIANAGIKVQINFIFFEYTADELVYYYMIVGDNWLGDFEYNYEDEDLVPYEEVETESQKTMRSVDQLPEFPGGIDGLMNYFQTNLTYPDEARENGIEGRVVLEFIVEKDGSIREINFINHVDKDLDMEAVRIVSEMPKWKPALVDGEPVRCFFTLPITFKLTEEDQQQ